MYKNCLEVLLQYWKREVVQIYVNILIEHIMRNARLDESQTGIMIPGRNINNHSYVDDTTLMAESEEELKSF